jgi:methyl-accepting chemotaxis protein
MKTRFATGIAKEKDGFEAGKKAASQALAKLEEKPDFAIVFSSSEYDYKKVIEGIREVIGKKAKLIGCSSAGEFTEESVQKGSVALALITSDNYKFFTGFGRGVRKNEIDALKEASSNLPKYVEGYPYLSAINLHDGLAGKGEEIVTATIRVLGSHIKFGGGSAADDLKMKETYVFEDENVATDAVALALLASKTPVIITVEHGHKPISPPFEVTKAKGNMVYELNEKPAFEVWKDCIREKALERFGIDIDKVSAGSSELIKVLTAYPLGLYTGDGYKIRWLGIEARTDALVATCGIPEGTIVRVMESSKEEQIESARKAARKAKELAGDKEIAGAFVFDCAVRGVILGEEFPKAVEAICQELKVPLVGFETYGEVCAEIGELSGFHNTTTVIMLLPE